MVHCSGLLVTAREIITCATLVSAISCENTPTTASPFCAPSADVEGLRMRQAKETFQHMHHEFHRRVIIIQQHDLVERRAQRLGLGLGQDGRITPGPLPGLSGVSGQGQRRMLTDRAFGRTAGYLQIRQYSAFCWQEKGLVLSAGFFAANSVRMTQPPSPLSALMPMIRCGRTKHSFA